MNKKTLLSIGLVCFSLALSAQTRFESDAVNSNYDSYKQARVGENAPNQKGIDDVTAKFAAAGLVTVPGFVFTGDYETDKVAYFAAQDQQHLIAVAAARGYELIIPGFSWTGNHLVDVPNYEAAKLAWRDSDPAAYRTELTRSQNN